MSSSNMFSFRTSVGGFNKKDVVEYIANENKRFGQAMSALESSLAEDERIISEMKSSFNEILTSKNAEIAEKDKLIEELTAKLEESKTELDTASSEVANLRILLDGCNEQLKQYTERIAVLEGEYAAKDISDNEKQAHIDDLQKEISYLKSKYVQLQGEYNALAERGRTFPRKDNGESKPTSGQQSSADSAGRRRTETKRGITPSDKTVKNLSLKSVDAIKAISSLLEEIMPD